jgi:hypothetical protein
MDVYEVKARSSPADLSEDHTMAVWFVFAVPIIVMVFALFMERVETRLRPGAVREDEVEAFLDNPRPDEVRALYGHGIGRALELFRLRNRRVRARARKVMNAPTIRMQVPPSLDRRR